jgi:hypothetical protein
MGGRHEASHVDLIEAIKDVREAIDHCVMSAYIEMNERAVMMISRV